MSKSGKRVDLLSATAHAATMLALGVGGFVSMSGQAYAQDASQDQEIVVTATRRSQALQDVPIAVTPVTADMVEHSGIRDIQDLTSVAPSLQFNVSESESSATARLRGVGTQGSNPGLESAVGIFVDGVYRARNGVALTDLGEVQQIEVLRGPQGTLFGRNTSAGLISITTVSPDLTAFGATGEATYGDFDETRLAVGLNIPLVENVAGIRINATRATRDGFMDMNPDGSNPLLGATSSSNQAQHDSNDRDMYAFRGQFLWQPSDTVDFRFILDYAERQEQCCAAQIYNPVLLNGNPVTILQATGLEGAPVPYGVGRQQWTANLGGYGANVSGAAPLGAQGDGDIGARTGFANRSYNQNLEDYGASGELNWDLDIGTLTSITAYRQWTQQGSSDSDYSQADLLYVPDGGHTQFKTFTQELRLSGEWGRLNWLVGAFYSNETIDRNFAFYTGSQYAQYFAGLDNVLVGGAQTPGLGNLPGAGVSAVVNNLYDELLTGPGAIPVGAGTAGYNDNYLQHGNSIAFFTHNIFSITSRTDLTVGVRFTHEEKDLSADFNTLFSGQTAFTAAMNQAAAQTGVANLAAYNNCNTGQTLPALPGAVLSVVAVARSGYCVPWLRTELDAVGYDQHRSEDEWSGVVSLRQELTDRISVYGSYSRGYKGGGFNLDRNFAFVTTGGSPDTSFNAELVDAYELGLKSGWFGGALLLNLAVYKNEFENFQLNTFNGIQFVVTTVPAVTSQGAELDAMWRTPIEGLSFQGGVAYTDATYGDDCSPVVSCGGWVQRNRNPITGEPTLARLPGSQLTNAPEWTTTAAFTYERPIFGGLMMLAYLDARYVDDQNTGSDLRPSKEQPSYTLVNARLGLGPADEHWSFEIWARNVFDEEYAQIMFDVPLQLGSAGPTQGAFLGDPRTVGVTLRARY